MEDRSRSRRRHFLIAVAIAGIAAYIRARVTRRFHLSASRGKSPSSGLALTSRSKRTAALGGIASRIAAAEAAHRARRLFASAERREELDTAHQFRTGEQVAEALGNMRGVLMKVGQMASYLDDGLPEPIRDSLTQLQQNAPPMSSELAAGVVEQELGKPPDALFAEWDPTPIAAASIGQVHRAITHDNRAVAVKVQYPGVDQAIRADVDNTAVMVQMLGLVFKGLDPGPMIEEIRVRLLEEIDYCLEAEHQQLFADYYRGHPFIHVPDVVRDFSTSRVLTTELVSGARFGELESWSQEERNLAAESIYRFVFRSIYRMRAFNGDPHPGNYLFHGGGRVSFLDFGLVKHYDQSEIALFEELVREIVLDRNHERFRAVLVREGLLAADAPVSTDDVIDYFGHFYDIIQEDEVSTFTHEFASETVARSIDLKGNFAQVTRYTNAPPAFVVLQRINLGLYAVMAKLNATGNWRRIAEELWPMCDGPPSTPMGEAEAQWLAMRPTARVRGS